MILEISIVCLIMPNKPGSKRGKKGRTKEREEPVIERPPPRRSARLAAKQSRGSQSIVEPVIPPRRRSPSPEKKGPPQPESRARFKLEQNSKTARKKALASWFKTQREESKGQRDRNYAPPKKDSAEGVPSRTHFTRSAAKREGVSLGGKEGTGKASMPVNFKTAKSISKSSAADASGCRTVSVKAHTRAGKSVRAYTRKVCPR